MSGAFVLRWVSVGTSMQTMWSDTTRASKSTSTCPGTRSAEWTGKKRGNFGEGGVKLMLLLFMQMSGDNSRPGGSAEQN